MTTDIIEQLIFEYAAKGSRVEKIEIDVIFKQSLINDLVLHNPSIVATSINVASTIQYRDVVIEFVEYHNEIWGHRPNSTEQIIELIPMRVIATKIDTTINHVKTFMEIIGESHTHQRLTEEDKKLYPFANFALNPRTSTYENR